MAIPKPVLMIVGVVSALVFPLVAAAEEPSAYGEVAVHYEAIRQALERGLARPVAARLSSGSATTPRCCSRSRPTPTSRW